ncbi:MAG: DegT/DnrJ/EryC1/StrS family aminotransferase [Pseudomonadota bacterium]|uniref:DegT/DnrJ/EryC1/StrS family aminotransferase n=1 Tax=Roseovarius salincola TaxID=2978479 RepID=UPI0022A83F61|nr:DegT/DnrJ/EryC1/StrS family aminotransferase [Roseovarius sp. EGI FJ00037]MCZ0814018.1 DegT/DnrJ/EryC1/StrS family aminotransferase [Roseovarius sp. EGI FJ00037]
MLELARQESRTGNKNLIKTKSVRDTGMRPEVGNSIPGFEFILEALENNRRFVVSKINHGFWECISRMLDQNIDPRRDHTAANKSESALIGRVTERIKKSLKPTSADIAENLEQIEHDLNLRPGFLTDGFIAQTLERIRTSAQPSDGFHLVATCAPFPASSELMGAPREGRKKCDRVIETFVPAAHNAFVSDKEFTGHEFKSALLSGEMPRFLEACLARDVIVVANKYNRRFFETAKFRSLTVVECDDRVARLERDQIADRVVKAIGAVAPSSEAEARPPLILSCIGGSLSFWLADTLWKTPEMFQFVDMGGAPAAFSEHYAANTNWSQIFAPALKRAASSFEGFGDIEDIYDAASAIRSQELTELAAAHGVETPAAQQTDIFDAFDVTKRPLPFIENKPYNFERIQQFLALSSRANHHANGGPVSRLLEAVAHHKMRLAPNHSVVAVASGTAALHIACAIREIAAGGQPMHWLTSGFNFFSANVGPLAATRIIDSDRTGRLTLDGLRKTPIDSYDGVIFTNLFAANRNWTDIAAFCKENGKAFVVDNATGLLDRPARSAEQPDFEAISCHHTKPWGVGEGGLLVCPAEFEGLARQVSNFGVKAPACSTPHAGNFKLSDLAAAGILDRLETLDFWGYYYARQSTRMIRVVRESGLPWTPLTGDANPKSPRTHTPFVSDVPVGLSVPARSLTVRKYYKPLEDARACPDAHWLYDRIVCLPNAPVHRHVGHEELVQNLLAFHEENTGAQSASQIA